MENYYTIKELMVKFKRPWLTIHTWIKRGEFGKEGEGWKRSGPGKTARIIVFKDVAEKVLAKFT